MSSSIPVFNADQTAALIPFAPLCDYIAEVAVAYESGKVYSPERHVLPLAGDGVLLSMPATAEDIGINKLVNVCPANQKQGLATINGLVSVYDAQTGVPRLILDGPTVTGRRTAAVTMLAIRQLYFKKPNHVSIIGAGKQSASHVEALAAMYPGIRVDIHGLNQVSVEAFCQKNQQANLDLRPCTGAISADSEVVITLTTAKQPVYNLAAIPNRLIIGVGAFRPDMAEIGPDTIAGSELYADDPAGARHEAGDYLQANVDWDQVKSLASLFAPDFRLSAAPKIFKSVGTAAWDLAAARCALANYR